MDYEALWQRLEGASAGPQLDRVLRSLADADIEVAEAANAALREENPRRRERALHRVRNMVELRALAQGTQPRSGAAAAAKRVKASPVYQDRGPRDESNWLGNALSRLKNLRFDLPQPKQTAPDMPSLGIGPWLVWLMWGLLGAGVLFFAYLALRHVDWTRRLTRKTKTLLEDDEPERSLDEWLALADTLSAEGRHREAVRCLYLACLLKFDEARVARFDRSQTNWEHLARIRSSPRKPETLDFLTPTQSFDRVWYGRQVEGAPDVERFRAWYQSVTEALRTVPA
jgi:hypothetical protein